MTMELENLNEEIKELKQANKKLKRKMMINRMESQTEIESIQRKQDLLNLLSPRTEMEDLVKVLFAYIIRLIPFNKAYMRIIKQEFTFTLMVSAKRGKIHVEGSKPGLDSINALIKNVLINRKGYLINNLNEYDKMLFSEKKTAMIFPLFISENSSAVCYFENDTLGSYSNKEFEIIREMLQETSLIILNAIDSTMLSRYKNQLLFGPVTGLYTNYYLKSVLEKQIIISKSTKRPFSLILGRLDNGDSENIDESIMETAKAFKRLTREVDSVFQFNRDSLALLINNSNSEVAEIVLERLESNINKKLVFGDYTFSGEENILNTDIIKKVKEQVNFSNNSDEKTKEE